MRRLLVVTAWSPWPPVNGSQQRVYHLLGEISKTHDVTLAVVTSRPHGDIAAALADRCTAVEVLETRTTARTAHWLSDAPRYLLDAYDPAVQHRVDALVRGHDAAYAFSLRAALYLRRERRVPTLLEELEVGVIQQRRAARSAGTRLRHVPTWWKLRRFVRRLVDEYDHVTVVSDEELRGLAEAGADTRHVTIVPNASPAPPGRLPGVAVVADSLVYPGSPTYAANLDAMRWFVDRVLPLLRRRGAHVRVTVTGGLDGLDPERLPRAPEIEYVGLVDDIDRVIAASGVCIVPLLEGGGTRLKVLHALALGTPVVSTRKGIEGLDLVHDREVVVADDAESFADGIVRVLGDAAFRSALGDRGLEVVRQRFTWSRSGARLAEALGLAEERWRARTPDTRTIER